MKLSDVLSRHNLDEMQRLATMHGIRDIRVHNMGLDDWPEGINPLPLLVYETSPDINDDFGPTDFKTELERLLKCEIDMLPNPTTFPKENSVVINFRDPEGTLRSIVSLFNSDRKAGEPALTADNIEFTDFPKALLKPRPA